MATDTGFSAPAALAQVIKENLLQLNKRLTQSRYLKGVNAPGGITGGSCAESIVAAGPALEAIRGDINSLEEILENSVSFMDRLDGTGTLNKKVAEDFGITGLAGRSSGVPLDLRSIFPGDCGNLNFHPLRSDVGDVRARLEIRLEEISGSFDIIRHFTGLLAREAPCGRAEIKPAKGEALGYAEGWRGPVLFWVKTGEKGIIERCKIVDASFLNWAGLAYSVPGNIIPDFPLCNKSFDLSYPGGDL
jgi:Ni,Fe-hydrogenase III large subunit